MYHKKLLNVVYVLLVVIFFASCVSDGKDGNSNAATNTQTSSSNATTNSIADQLANKSKAEVIDAINTAEKNLYGDKSNLEFDKDKAQDLVNTYNVFTGKVSVYGRIVKDYPNFDKVPHSLFLQGFSHENDLKNLPQAKVAYEDFLKRFPDHELADDVQFSLTNLGKTPEEIIEGFEKIRKENEGK